MQKILLLALILSPILAGVALDATAQITATQYGCLYQQFFRKAIVRAYNSANGVDAVGKANALTAKDNGFSVDAYVLPCIGGIEAEAQAQATIDAFGSLIKNYWIQVYPNQSSGCKWKENDPTSNCQSLNSLVSAFAGKGAKVGIFSSQAWWKQVFGDASACASLNNVPLWYQNLDQQADLSDYSKNAFGGWKSAQMKQFQQSSICGVQDLGIDFTN